MREDKRAPGGFELTVKHFKVYAPATDYPITPKEHGVAFLLDLRHLWVRSARQHAILRVRDEVAAAAPRVLPRARLRAVRRADPDPDLVRGHHQPVRNRLLRRAQGLPHAERPALCRGRRAGVGQGLLLRPHLPRREVQDAAPSDGVLDGRAGGRLLSTWSRTCSSPRTSSRTSSAACSSGARADLETLERDLEPLRRAAATPYPRITYDEAIERLKAKGLAIKWGDDLGGDEETALSAEFDRPVMVHRYPAECKAFYMKRDPERPEVALCVDMLAPEGYGEIIGGGQREDDYETLRARIVEHGLPVEPLQLVPRPPALRLGAARGVRDGHRAGGGMALRAASYPRDDPVSANDGTAGALGKRRRGGLPACSPLSRPKNFSAHNNG